MILSFANRITRKPNLITRCFNADNDKKMLDVVYPGVETMTEAASAPRIQSKSPQGCADELELEFRALTASLREVCAGCESGRCA